MDYRIVRSKRKTVSLSVLRTGEVVVRAPIGLSEQRIHEFVTRHAAWLSRKLSERSAQPFVDLSAGSRLILFGEEYLLADGRTRIADGTIFLPIENREAALVRVLKKLAAEVMEKVARFYAQRYGFTFAGIRISSARSRWGSCNRNGVISFSFRNAFLPPDLSEYVAVHELCHTVFFDHSAKFWNLAESIFPDCKLRRKRLHDASAIMNLL